VARDHPQAIGGGYAPPSAATGGGPATPCFFVFVFYFFEF